MPELSDSFLFTVSGLSDEVRVVNFKGREGISELFNYVLTAVSESSTLEFDDIVGKDCLLTMKNEGGDPTYVSGIVKRFESNDYGKKLTSYRFEITPKHWKMTRRADCRIFQEMKAGEIIKKVLDGAGLASGDDYRISLQGTYASREYCVQYRETDFDFISRLMEEEGISYYFEHSDTKHVMAIVDKPTSFSAIEGEASIPFRPLLGSLEEGDQINHFHFSQQISSGKVTLREYDFKKPGLLLESTSSAASSTDLEVYNYRGGYVAPGDGDALAKVRVEQEQVGFKTAKADSNCRRIRSGYKMTLAEHPREAFNAEYLVTSVECEGTEPAFGEEDASESNPRFKAEFLCIPAAVPFRPQLSRRKPEIGLQTAIVTGPSGEEIHTDEHGRIKVQFHWDRLGKKDDKSSCWMRVAQTVAGEGWGAMVLPRIKQEVLIDFEEGDVDRPIVIGCVYHGSNVPPYALPGEKTKTTIKTNTSTGGGGFNELRFEDKKSSEEIYLHGQKDYTIKIENDKNQEVVHDETRKVGNDATEEVVHDEKYKVGNDATKEIVHDEKYKVGNDATKEIVHDETYKVGNNQTITVTKDQKLTVSNDQTVKIDGKQTETISKDRAITINGKDTLTVTGKIVITSDAGIELTVAGNTIKIDPGGVTINGKKIGIEGSVQTDVKGLLTNVSSDGPLALKGAIVKLN